MKSLFLGLSFIFSFFLLNLRDFDFSSEEVRSIGFEGLFNSEQIIEFDVSEAS